VTERDAFVARHAALFEHSPWVAQEAYDRAGPFGDENAALAAMVRAVREAPRERQLALIRAHPDLAGRAAIAGELTEDSTREQASAGLDRLTPEEYETFAATNAAYRERHGFPFVICAREHDKASILAAAAERLDHDTETEVQVALDEIAKIARLRLESLR
jgi:OHCU decarboxylase